MPVTITNSIAPAFEQLIRIYNKSLCNAIFKGEIDGLFDIAGIFLVADNMHHAVSEGYGINPDEADDDLKAKLKTFRTNTFQFSVYKNAKLVKELQLVRDLVETEKAFTKQALQVATNYNINYLNTEMNWAGRVAAQARRWTDIQLYKEKFPFLEFHTREDERVRLKHSLFNEKRFPVNHPFWLVNYPPIKGDWGCRCFVTQEFEPGDDQVDEKYLEVDEDNIAPAISGKIFDTKSHPYFKGWTKREKDELNKVAANEPQS